MEEDIREEQPIDLRDYLRVIRKRRWTVITVFAVIVITVAIHSFTATPMYQASTRLVIEKENPKVVSIQEVMAVDAAGTDYYQTQYKIIESRAVAREVIKRLRLGESEEFAPGEQRFVSKLTGFAAEKISSGVKSLVSMVSGRPQEETPGADESPEDTGLIATVISRTKVEPIRNSRLVDVSFVAKDRALAAKAANTVASAYIDKNLETKLRAAQEAVRWLNDRIDEERKKVEKAEQALLRYKEKNSIITNFSSDTENVTAQKLAQINQQVVDAESRRVEAETRYRQASSLSNAPDMMDSIPEVLSNAMIQNIKGMEVELYKKASELSKKYGENHPQMVALDSELKTLQNRKRLEVQRVINALKNEYTVALARENSLKAALEKQKNESLELNQKAIEYGVLQREAESAKQMYDLLIKRFKETSLVEDMQTGNIRVIDRAETPRAPVRPRKQLNIMLAIVVGLVMGVGLAFFFEYLDNTIKLPEDIKRHLQVPYLGPVPAIALNGDVARPGEPNPLLVTVHAPKATASEAYRGIRTSILFSSADRSPQVVLVSSAGPLEGKSLTSANLAVTMAQAETEAVLIDCDMRRPTAHKIFGLPRDRGVSSLLVGACGFEEAVVKTQVPNLDVIPCGPIPPNPSELLGSGRMVKLVEMLRKKYARIIIDSPPLTAVTDAVVLSKLADGVVIVVRAADTPREFIKNGLSQLHSVNAHVLGVVLNGVEMGREGHYYYQYYYYYYGEDGDMRKKTKSRRQKPAYEYEDQGLGVVRGRRSVTAFEDKSLDA